MKPSVVLRRHGAQRGQTHHWSAGAWLRSLLPWRGGCVPAQESPHPSLLPDRSRKSRTGDKLAQTLVSHITLGTWGQTRDTPQEMRLREEERTPNNKEESSREKGTKDNKVFIVITLQKKIPSVLCKKCVKAKSVFFLKKSMLHELQCNQYLFCLFSALVKKMIFFFCF